MHPLLDATGYYQPSKAAKLQWRRTRKTIRSYGDIKLPGLFDTRGFNTDKILFRIAILLELIGVYAIYWAAGQINALLIGGFILGIGVDIVLAIFAHYYAGTICEFKNWKIIEEYYANSIEKNSIKFPTLNLSRDHIRGFTQRAQEFSNKIFNKKLFHGIFNTLIIIMALIKIYFFIQIGGDINPITYGVIFIYLSIAYIHIMHTAYYLAENKFRNMLKKESIIFYDNCRKTNIDLQTVENKLIKHLEIDIDNRFGYKINTVSSGKNSLTLVQDKYYLNVWEILQDDDLYTIANVNQKDDDNDVIDLLGIKGLEIQLRLLNNEPDYIFKIKTEKK